MSRCRFIDGHRAQVPVRELCTALQVAPSSYHACRKHRPQPAPAWERTVVRAFQRHGTRRLRAEVRPTTTGSGTGASGALRVRGLRAQPPRSFVPRTTDLVHGRRAAPNCLLYQPHRLGPGVGEQRHLPAQTRRCLASWQDACSRKVVGWDVRETEPENLISEALRRVLAVRRPAAGLVVHSDPGRQYTAARFGDLLARHGQRRA